jgi:hypothetical protein
MDRESLNLATPVLTDQDDPDGDGADGAEPSGGRRFRHVLIPSELVHVEFTLPDADLQTLQADLINVSGGGCCLVLPCRLPLLADAQGVLVRPGEVAGSEERRPFVVRWLQDLGEMMEVGAQFCDA